MFGRHFKVFAKLSLTGDYQKAFAEYFFRIYLDSRSSPHPEKLSPNFLPYPAPPHIKHPVIIYRQLGPNRTYVL